MRFPTVVARSPIMPTQSMLLIKSAIWEPRPCQSKLVIAELMLCSAVRIPVDSAVATLPKSMSLINLLRFVASCPESFTQSQAFTAPMMRSYSPSLTVLPSKVSKNPTRSCSAMENFDTRSAPTSPQFTSFTRFVIKVPRFFPSFSQSKLSIMAFRLPSTVLMPFATPFPSFSQSISSRKLLTFVASCPDSPTQSQAFTAPIIRLYRPSPKAFPSKVSKNPTRS